MQILTIVILENSRTELKVAFIYDVQTNTYEIKAAMDELHKIMNYKNYCDPNNEKRFLYFTTFPKLIFPGSRIRAEVLHPGQGNPSPLYQLHNKWECMQCIIQSNSACLWLAFAWTEITALLAMCQHEWNSQNRCLCLMMGSDFHKVDFIYNGDGSFFLFWFNLIQFWLLRLIRFNIFLTIYDGKRVMKNYIFLIFTTKSLTICRVRRFTINDGKSVLKTVLQPFFCKVNT